MPKILTFFHTAQVHSETFDALRDRIAPGVVLHHNIRASWLARAQGGIDAALAADIRREVSAARQPAICTCTTIGPIAEAAGAVRIDQPMMWAAAETGGPVLMVYCLDSTRQPSRDLLETAMLAAGNDSGVEMLPLTGLWPIFEAGEAGEFAQAIADGVRRHVSENPSIGCVVLAQASMAGAAALLDDMTIPVLSSPELALRAGLARL